MCAFGEIHESYTVATYRYTNCIKPYLSLFLDHFCCCAGRFVFAVPVLALLAGLTLVKQRSLQVDTIFECFLSCSSMTFCVPFIHTLNSVQLSRVLNADGCG